jgi:transcriptional regulator of acetoin/glycerol metabolism
MPPVSSKRAARVREGSAPPASGAPGSGGPRGRPKEAPAKSEEEVRAALEATEWNVGKAAEILGMSSRGTMLRLMEKLGVKRSAGTSAGT